MNVVYLRRILPAILLLAGLQNASAQNKPNPITTPVPFLRVSADARTGAMGDISVATSPDATSIFYNNGKTAFNANKFGITATYTPWLSELDLKSLYMASVAGFYKLNDNEAVSLGMRYFSMGDLSFTDNLGQELKVSDLQTWVWKRATLASFQISSAWGLLFATSTPGLPTTPPQEIIRRAVL